MNYLGLPDAKAHLGLVNSNDDALVAGYLSSAQTIVELCSQQVFEASTNTTKYFDVERDVLGRTLYFKNYLCAINTITNGDGVLITAASYVTEPRNETPYFGVTVKRSAGLFWTWTDDPENAIAVSGKWAYSLTAPQDIVQVMRWLVQYLYRNKDSSGDLARSMIGPGGILLPVEMPHDLRIVLDRYVPKVNF